MYVLGKLFQHSLLFVSKVGAYPSEAPFMCSTLGLEGLTGEKDTSLLQTLVNYNRKKFNNIGHRCRNSCGNFCPTFRGQMIDWESAILNGRNRFRRRNPMPSSESTFPKIPEFWICPKWPTSSSGKRSRVRMFSTASSDFLTLKKHIFYLTFQYSCSYYNYETYKLNYNMSKNIEI